MRKTTNASLQLFRQALEKLKNEAEEVFTTESI